ncbi:cell wall hydrolase [Caulobacter sp.]|uniref:cell wall hydrolase n=1 Tax=Caulobacter sp. TaxID=78 RepID=UPI0031DA8D38
MSQGRVLAGALALVTLSAAPACAWGQVSAERPDLARLRAVVEAPGARDAIARVTWAEAAGQGDSGLAGVVYTILNRLSAGRWGESIDQVVNARAQFEPVLRAGGDWRALPAVRPAERARIDTILNLALEGRLPDLTGGALFFQNPKIVAARAAAGTVSPRLVHFGGAAPSVVIGDHAFYPDQGGGTAAAPVDPLAPAGGAIFPDQGRSPDTIIVAVPAPGSPALAAAGPRGLIVLPTGEIVEDPARLAAPQP